MTMQGKSLVTIVLTGVLLFSQLILCESSASEVLIPQGPTMLQTEELKLTNEWDKTFAKSETVDHCKVTFVNRYGITLAGDLYIPKNAKGPLPALAVCGPFGAVKEQCAGLYAQTMAERGFLSLAFDPSFTGESGGAVRFMASPDINTEDFMAAVDFLSLHEKADPKKIGILGICGWGGMALNAAALDTRVKATVSSTMYDMTRVSANGYFDSEDSEEARYAKKSALCAQRLADLKARHYKLLGGVPGTLPSDAPQFVKEYYDYYKTPRGYHERALNSNGGWTVIGCQSFLNQPILMYSGEIRSAVLLIHGEKAHSCYFSKDAYANMTKNSKFAANKELYLIPGASHTDLYDGGAQKVIPFEKIAEFFMQNLQ
ncbi:MAG: alpha/beta hydrolase [Desulfovibrionaceae bacterium]|nr:alpha/beta hydrolase [Desulfovibrionaceae bacterium]